VGGSGDGGIDDIVSLDRLGLEKVYVQAKHWKNPVGSPEIQTFMGALQLQSASKGVFITTSVFTKDAKASAERARGTIVIVDGALITSLMMTRAWPSATSPAHPESRQRLLRRRLSQGDWITARVRAATETACPRGANGDPRRGGVRDRAFQRAVSTMSSMKLLLSFEGSPF